MAESYNGRCCTWAKLTTPNERPGFDRSKSFDEDARCQKRLKLFASEREIAESLANAVQVRLSEFELRRPRQWGACWLFRQLWEQLGLREFWSQKLGASREGTDWEHVLEALVAYRLIDPGSEWRMHRHWYAHSDLSSKIRAGSCLVL